MELSSHCEHTEDDTADLSGTVSREPSSNDPHHVPGPADDDDIQDTGDVEDAGDVGDTGDVEDTGDLEGAGAAPGPMQAAGEIVTRRHAHLRGPNGDRSTVRFLKRGANVGRYMVLERIGMGGMGVVYAAYDPDLDRKIALKLVRVARSGSFSSGSQGSIQARESLVREARAMASLSHRNVIPVFDVGVHDAEVFFAMELVDGCTLRRWLRTGERSVPEILDAFVQAGRGLLAAHAEGIAHRDFKPTNVLMGRDGTVRVMDFGLAGQSENSGWRVQPGEREGVGLFGTGSSSPGGKAMGTPAYMPPEQHESEHVDPRSDQYSFCVTLFEALYDVRPFSPSPGETLLAAKKRGVPASVSPRLERRVPRRVRQALARGLNPNPDQRFPSMGALIDALSPVRRRRWAGGIAAAAFAVVAGSTASVAYANHVREQANLCTGGPQRLEGVWDDAVRAEVHAAFTAVETPYASAAWDRVRSQLDDRTSAWVGMFQDACEATHVRGEQTAELMDERMRCLERQRADVRALTRVFVQADAAVVERAAAAVGSLPPVSDCADLQALASGVKLPSDPQMRDSVRAIRDTLSEGRALRLAGKYDRARAVLEAALEEARATGFEPLVVEAMVPLGSTVQRAGKYDRAEQLLSEAVELGTANRQDRLAISAASSLVYVSGYKRAKVAEAKIWARQARGLLRRMGGDDRLEADLENELGATMSIVGTGEEVYGHMKRALELLQKSYDPDHPRLPVAWSNLGFALLQLDRRQEAVEAFEEAVEVGKRAFGDAHPELCLPANNLGYSRMIMGRYDEAREGLSEMVAICTPLLGEDHSTVGLAVGNLGALLVDAKKFDEAEIMLNRAKSIAEKALGEDHPDAVATATSLGWLREEQGRYSDALAIYQRAVDIVGEKAPEGSQLAGHWVELARVKLELGQVEEAHGLATAGIERALEHSQSDLATEARWILARTSAKLGDPSRARRLAASARVGFEEGLQPLDARRVREIDTWLRALPRSDARTGMPAGSDPTQGRIGAAGMVRCAIP